jgi:hypothetical protein
MLTLDNLAHRYNCLPSEALARATTFDLKVLDLSSKYVKYLHDKENGITPQAKHPSQSEMIEMLKRARNEQ